MIFSAFFDVKNKYLLEPEPHGDEVVFFESRSHIVVGPMKIKVIDIHVVWRVDIQIDAICERKRIIGNQPTLFTEPRAGSLGFDLVGHTSKWSKYPLHQEGS